MFKTKILMLGPCESGKTAISNFLSEASEQQGGLYHATCGVRIVEFESQGLNVNGRTMNGEVELWDVSGDRKFENCWPAIARDASGIIFVYNPDAPNHDKELDSWYTHFVKQQGLRDSQCIVFKHQRPSAHDREIIELSGQFSRIPVVQSNLEEDPEGLHLEFRNFLSTLLSAMSDKREQEELSIMNQR
ncbi:intraflagellar transport protein 22 homolog [Lineus longissimus]|uniref:intraflagellar transport protein 22 homolog n=1 Tax=Lineus longissimus TaxID=88925 RepID=UPI002B4DF773